MSRPPVDSMLKKAKSLLANAALAVALLAGAVAVAAETGAIVTERPPGGLSVVERPSPKIGVRGHVDGLYPGVQKEMKVRVTNGLAHPVKLVSVRARIADASATCTRENLTAKRFKGARKVPARSRASVRVNVSMSEIAPTACQDARFPIKFKARVTAKR